MQICCSICKDIFIPHSEVMVTKCGHLYHDSCISVWCKQHLTCPQCRSKLKEKPHRVYFDVENDTDTDPSSLQYKIDKLTYNLQVKDSECKKVNEKLSEKESMLASLKQHALDKESEVEKLKETIRALKKEINYNLDQMKSLIKMEREYELLKSKVDTLGRVECLVKGTVEEVDKMLRNSCNSPMALRQLCTYVQVLKQQIHKNDGKRLKALEVMKEAERDLSLEKKKNQTLSDQVDVLRIANEQLSKDVKNLNDLLNKQEKTGSFPSPVLKIAKKRPNSSFNQVVRENINADSTNSPDVAAILSDKLGSKTSLFSLDKKIVNNLESKEKKHKSDSDNLELEGIAGPSKVSFKPLSVSSNVSIFQKRTLPTYTLQSRSDRSDSNLVSDGMGGSRKFNLATPSPREELMAAVLNQKLKKKPRKLTNLPSQMPKPSVTLDSFLSI